MAGMFRDRASRICSQIITVRQTDTATGKTPTKTLAKPDWPGWNGRLSSCQTVSATAARPAIRATSPAIIQGPLLPALIRCKPTVLSTALTTTRAMIAAPYPACGGVVELGSHLECPSDDWR